VQVHHDDVRGELSHEPYGVCAGRSLARDRDAALLEQVAQPGSKQVVIVHEQNPHAGGATLVPDLHSLAQNVPPSSKCGF